LLFDSGLSAFLSARRRRRNRFHSHADASGAGVGDLHKDGDAAGLMSVPLVGKQLRYRNPVAHLSLNNAYRIILDRWNPPPTELLRINMIEF